jgi:O-antigen ligase/polysaccharide polymerase Wzy-like membrane protein
MSCADVMIESESLARPELTPPSKMRPGASLSFFFVWLFIVAIYARPEDIFPPLGALHLTFLLGACAALTFAWSLLLGNVRLTWPRELQIMLALTAWFIAGVPFAYWRGGSIQVLTQTWLKTLLIFFLMTQLLVTLRRIYAVLWAIILSELAVTGYSLLESSQVRWVGERLYGVSLGILGWNFLGIAAALTIPFIAAIFISQPSLVKSCALVAATGSTLWMLMLTASRSGMLAVSVSIVLTCILVLRNSSRGRIIGVGISLAFLVTLCLAPAVFWERMDTTLAGESSSSSGAEGASAVMSENSRWSVLMRSVDYSFENPVFGLGLGNLMAVNGNELQRPDAWIGSHNTFAEISSEAGFPALLLFVWLMGTASRSMMRVGGAPYADPHGEELGLFARAGLASLLSAVFGSFFAHIGYEYFLYTCPLAIAVGIRRIASDYERVSTPLPCAQAAMEQELKPRWAS